MRFARRLPHHGSRIDDGVIRLAIPPTLDAAPAVAARELGCFARHGLQVRLCREPGWATTRDKLLQREVDAAIGPAAYLYSLYRGIGVVRQPCLTALLLPSGGCAITLSAALSRRGLAHPDALRDLVRGGGLERRLTFAIAPAPGPEGEFLDAWLRERHLDPARDVRRVSLPPALVLEHLRRGWIDGFCQAEPWNAAAVAAGLGETASTPPPAPLALDRALLVLRDFTEDRPDEHLHLVAALIEGARHCAAPDNLPGLARILSSPRYCGVDAAVIATALARLRSAGPTASATSMAPATSQVRRILGSHDATAGKGRVPAELIRRVFRHDLYVQAAALSEPRADSAESPPETPRFLPCLASAAAAFGIAPLSVC